MVTDSIQLSHFFEVVGAREATGVCMQDLVFIRNRTFVCTCSEYSSYLFVGRSELE